MIVSTMRNVVMSKPSLSGFTLAVTVLGVVFAQHDEVFMSKEAAHPTNVASMRFLVAVNHTWEK